MPLQNRVTPFGEIVATPERGAWMGNRGCLHDDKRTLTRRRWTTRAWIVCLTEFKGRRRTPMTPGRYTELFFLDEATALAAGHRPCAECRRADYLRFRDAGAAGRGVEAGTLRAAAMDEALHAERRRPLRERPRLDPADLPDGAFVLRDADAETEPRTAWLVRGGLVRPWSAGGYGAPETIGGGPAVLLTPPSTLAALAAGYPPQIDESALR